VTQEELRRLFPAGVIVEVATGADENEESLYAEERALMSAMAPARRVEFAAGRNAARRALAQLEAPRVPLLRHGADRDIAWPAGITGSISHTKGLVAVACGRVVPGVRSVGLDVEQAGPLGDDIVSTICRPEELGALARQPPPLPSDWPRLLFAIKEAAYKAWFPVTRREISFQQMRITLDVTERCFEAEVDTNVAAGLRITGRFGWDEPFVYAGAILTSSRPHVLTA
jgi:4'-phosphopantetheinyl transferase EntD